MKFMGGSSWSFVFLIAIALTVEANSVAAMDEIQAKAIDVIKETFKCPRPLLKGGGVPPMSIKYEYVGNENAFKLQNIATMATERGIELQYQVSYAEMNDLELLPDPPKITSISIRCADRRQCFASAAYNGSRRRLTDDIYLASTSITFCDLATAQTFTTAFNLLLEQYYARK